MTLVDNVRFTACRELYGSCPCQSKPTERANIERQNACLGIPNNIAKAAIDAVLNELREPTVGMISAGRIASIDTPAAVKIYQVMLDEKIQEIRG